MKLTKKRKDFLYNLLNHQFTLQALNSYYDSDDRKGFKEDTGFTFKEAEQALGALLEYLEK